MEMNYAGTGFKAPNLADFFPTTFRGDTPERRDVIRGRLPRGKVVLLAGEGDVGKSWLLLSLFEAINHGHASRMLGGQIEAKGAPCVLLFGEDDRASVDLRLKAVRSFQGTALANYGAIITSPDLGYMPLVKKDVVDSSIQPTDVFGWLDEQLDTLKAWGEPGFLAVDTWSTYFPVDTNSPHEVQAAISHLTRLAAKHDVCIVVTHHMKKGANQGDLRGGIRGTTAIVDGVRAAYVLHRVEAEDAKEICSNVEIEGEVIRLSLVKNNLGLRRDPVTFIRLQDGNLMDVSDLIGGRMSHEDALLKVIREAHQSGKPMSKTGKRGLYDNRNNTWPACIAKMSKGKITELADELITSGKLAIEGGVLVPVEVEAPG